MFFWGTSEEVPKNTSCRKLSCHKKLLTSYQRPVLGAGISCRGAAPGAASLLCTPARPQRSSQNILTAGNYEICTNTDRPFMGAIHSLLPSPSLEGLQASSLCGILTLAVFPKTWRVSHLTAKMMFLSINKTYVLLIRLLNPRVSPETFLSKWVMLDVMTMVWGDSCVCLCLCLCLCVHTRNRGYKGSSNLLGLNWKDNKKSNGEVKPTNPSSKNQTRTNIDFHTYIIFLGPRKVQDSPHSSCTLYFWSPFLL